MRIFKETQRFNQWWMKLLYITMIGFLLFCIYNWYFVGGATGNVKTNDFTGQIIVIISIVPVLLLLYSIKLKTIIDEIGVHYQFIPFHFSKRLIRWNEIERCYVRTYSSIKEFGGWGYRVSFNKKNGRAYNIKGDIGIQLEPKSGKKLLIGTQKEEEAERIIQRYFKTGDE